MLFNKLPNFTNQLVIIKKKRVKKKKKIKNKVGPNPQLYPSRLKVNPIPVYTNFKPHPCQG